MISFLPFPVLVLVPGSNASDSEWSDALPWPRTSGALPSVCYTFSGATIGRRDHHRPPREGFRPAAIQAPRVFRGYCSPAARFAVLDGRMDRLVNPHYSDQFLP